MQIAVIWSSQALESISIDVERKWGPYSSCCTPQFIERVSVLQIGISVSWEFHADAVVFVEGHFE